MCGLWISGLWQENQYKETESTHSGAVYRSRVQRNRCDRYQLCQKRKNGDVQAAKARSQNEAVLSSWDNGSYRT